MPKRLVWFEINNVILSLISRNNANQITDLYLYDSYIISVVY